MDCGAILWPPRGRDLSLDANVCFKSMEIMGYDVVNMGWNELVLGPDFLKAATGDTSFDFISSNIRNEVGDPSIGKHYIIKEVNNIRVAIVGLAPESPPSWWADYAKSGDFHWIDPEICLKNTISEIRDRVDAVILLSLLGFEKTVTLVDNVRGVDLAICKGPRAPFLDKPQIGRNGTLVSVIAAVCGQGLNRIDLNFDQSKQIIDHEYKRIWITGKFTGNKQVQDIIDAAKTSEQKDKADRDAKTREKIRQMHIQRLKMEAEMNKNIQMSPQEYIQWIKKNETKRKMIRK